MRVRWQASLMGVIHWWVWHKRVAISWLGMRLGMLWLLGMGMLWRDQVGALSSWAVSGRGARVMLRGMLPLWVRVEYTI